MVEKETIQTVVSSNGKFSAAVHTEGWEFIYRSSEHIDESEAVAEAQRWIEWRAGLAEGANEAKMASLAFDV
jgi:hypothetical protein